jgi:hypothetical protein
MMLKALMTVSLLLSAVNVFAATLSEMQVYGSSLIKSDSDDMWDKKNQAIYDAKKRATFKLARRVFKPEAMPELEKKIKRLVVPFSNRYLVSSTLLTHGLDESNEQKVYNARVSFKYSLANFKKLLKSKGFESSVFQKHKVAAFIEVMDVGAVKTFSWWNEKEPKLHPVLKPLQMKLAQALDEEGYELMSPRIFRSSMGMKDMSRLMGAQYYVSGFIKINKVSDNFKVKAGVFNFHEALSQKLVSRVDLEKFMSEPQTDQQPNRQIASVPTVVQKQDLLKSAFKGAVKTMNANENVDHLSHGVANLQFEGVSSPAEMALIKKTILTNLKQDVATLVERNIKNGDVTFVARTLLSPRRLLSLMNSSNIGLGTYIGTLKEDGKTLYFSQRN